MKNLNSWTFVKGVIVISLSTNTKISSYKEINWTEFNLSIEKTSVNTIINPNVD